MTGINHVVVLEIGNSNLRKKSNKFCKIIQFNLGNNTNAPCDLCRLRLSSRHASQTGRNEDLPGQTIQPHATTGVHYSNLENG